MKNLKLKDNSKALVIMAHPDDETIWMGGAILKHPKIDWTIFSLCRASDKDRMPKFKRVCKHYNAKSIITDLEDDEVLTIKQSISEIKKIIKKELKDKEFDYIFTHGENGEYGHDRHIGVHLAVKELVEKEIIKCKKLFFLNYCKISRKEFSPLRIRKNTKHLLKLNNKELDQKKQIMTKIYGFAPDGIDTNYCTKQEGFI